VNKETKKEQVREDAMSDDVVNKVVRERSKKMSTPLDINEFLAPYSSTKLLPGNANVGTEDGLVIFMRDGKEEAFRSDGDRRRSSMALQLQTSIQVLNDSVAKPFITTQEFDYSKGELPGIVSYSHAEKLLGLKELPRTSTNDEKLQRIAEVRKRLSEVTASFCYRNTASQALLSQAIQQRQQMDKNKNDKDYQEPSVVYQLPADDSCGAVTVVKDTRSAAQKRQEQNMIAYQKEIGEYTGDPAQHKITMRAIGLSSEMLGGGMVGSAGEMVMGLLGSWLTYQEGWTIPASMLEQAPASLRPTTLFPINSNQPRQESVMEGIEIDSYMVEFGDLNEARAALKRGGLYSASDDGMSISPFGSSVLIVDEFKRGFQVALLWALALVGGVAFIILAGLIGRMISDGRRESAVFRAIGARRGDIGRIYGVYTILLAIRVALFAMVLGVVIAIGVDIWLSRDATAGARLAYAAVDTAKEFHFVGIGSWYIPAILGAIVAVSLLAAAIPILLGARRNPITDMRNDA
jgi:hypothetical protein